MPLPAGGSSTAWPPEHMAPVLDRINTWAAWYEGDEGKLSAVYGGPATGGPPRAQSFFGSESGVRGAIGRTLSAARRWFWGNANDSGAPRTRLHVPIAGDIASASADLLFSEPPAVTVPTEDQEPGADGAEPEIDPTQARLDELLDDGAHATLLEAAEICAALGGVYLRVCWDPATRPDRPWLAAVHPDAAVPEWSMGVLVAVTFWRVIHSEKGKVVRHLERHEPGLISHGVYEGGEDTLGMPRPYADYEATKWLADLDLIDGTTIRTGIDTLAAVYVPNMRPNRVWRGTPGAAPLGRSDYAGVEPLMDALDLTYSSLIRDVDLGKARLVVPAEYMTSHGAGNGGSFELDREIFQPVAGILGSDERGMDIQQVQFDIRVEDHARAIALVKADVVRQAGYSSASFGLDDDGAAVTATEVRAKQERSLTTRGRKIRYWRPGLSDILLAMLGIDAAMFGTAITPVRPDVEWPDAVAEDPKAVAETVELWVRAEAASLETRVRRLHPDWDDIQVAEEIERIREDAKSAAIENPDQFRGLAPGESDVPEGEPPDEEV